MGEQVDEPVDYTLLFVDIIECLGDLYDHMSAQILAEVCQTNDLVEELSSWTELEYDVVVLVRLGEVDELDDIWMVELAHNLNFFEDIRTLQKNSGQPCSSGPKNLIAQM